MLSFFHASGFVVASNGSASGTSEKKFSPVSRSMASTVVTKVLMGALLGRFGTRKAIIFWGGVVS